MPCPKAVVLAVLASAVCATPGFAQTTFGLKAGVVSSDAKWGAVLVTVPVK